MKRLQIYLEEELDEVLAVRALQGRTSKAALIRQYVAEGIAPQRIANVPLDDLVGLYDEEPGYIDELVYGKRRSLTHRSG